MASTTSNYGKSNSWGRGLALMYSYMAVVAAVDGTERKSKSERVKECKGVYLWRVLEVGGGGEPEGAATGIGVLFGR